MVKQCATCGTYVSYEARFCHACGGSEFVISNQRSVGTNVTPNPNQSAYDHDQYAQNPPVQQSANPAWQPPVQQNWQQPTWNQPATPPKKKNTGLIIGIVVGIIALAGIGFIAEKAFQSQGYGDGGNHGDGYPIGDGYSSVDIEYTKGSFDGSVYTNEWADIELALPAGFVNADAATYAASEDEKTDCGMYFIANETMSLIYICYEKLPTFPAYDEESYLDAAINTLKSQTGITYEVADSYTTAIVAGRTYMKAIGAFSNGYSSFVQNIYVRKIDNYMVFISTIGDSEISNESLIQQIECVD